mmetsp:Transcript_101077/g.324675  ORF Transcript_101077/g.324675 Transcript_101077/m.324675 type:complete len:245 (-) Transcript_101077:2896-3630(-)
MLGSKERPPVRREELQDPRRLLERSRASVRPHQAGHPRRGVGGARAAPGQPRGLGQNQDARCAPALQLRRRRGDGRDDLRAAAAGAAGADARAAPRDVQGGGVELGVRPRGLETRTGVREGQLPRASGPLAKGHVCGSVRDQLRAPEAFGQVVRQPPCCSRCGSCSAGRQLLCFSRHRPGRRRGRAREDAAAGAAALRGGHRRAGHERGLPAEHALGELPARSSLLAASGGRPGPLEDLHGLAH